MNSYFKYIKERENCETIESDYGFIIYKEIDKDTVYFTDIWVTPEKRNTGGGTTLFNAASDLVKGLGYKKIIGSCSVSDVNCTKNIKHMINKGFFISNVSNDLIYLIKNISE